MGGLSMQVGFIGTGSMGSILINAFISSHALLPVQIVAHNRTPSKALELKKNHPDLVIADSNVEVVKQSNLIFLCVKPLEYKHSLDQFASHLTDDHVLVIITSPVSVPEVEQLVACPVIRVIPSITNAASSGLTLVEFGSRVSEEWRKLLLTLISCISTPMEIQENYIRIASDISSCGPAFISYILQQMIQSACEETGISNEAAVHLTTEMIIGVADLLKQGIFTLPELQERVCVPGGITGEGLIPLKQGFPGIFNQVFKRTHAKFHIDRIEVSEHLLNK